MSEIRNDTPLIEVRDLKEHFPIQVSGLKSKPLKAVDGVSFTINRGETLGLVGESGCGKTTVGRTILNLYKPTSGEIIYDGKPIKTAADIKEFRTKATMVFQDPYSSLNPRMTVADIIGEPLDVHKLYKTKEERQARILELMSYVGLNSEHAARYAHEFSGGQRQRIGIARALSVNPELIICDEAVSALDVSIQAQVLKLLNQLKEEYQLTYIFITHDLSVVEYLADRIAVMYLGRVVELTTSEELFANTLHPYTKALLSAIPVADVNQTKKRIPLQGDVPSPANPPSGCTFHPRCPEVCEKCKTERPMLEEYIIDGVSHFVSCHKVKEELAAKGILPVVKE